jgi:hypothetical protein
MSLDANEIDFNGDRKRSPFRDSGISRRKERGADKVGEKKQHPPGEEVRRVSYEEFDDQ